MQQAPVRLSQTIRAAFHAARPIHTYTSFQPQLLSRQLPRPSQPWPRPKCVWASQARLYSDSKAEVEKKVEDVKNRIDESLESRIDVASASTTKLKEPEHETIVHTIPEASSIVYKTGENGGKPSTPTIKSPRSSEPLPSQFSAHYSQMRKQFTHFMDNFQSHIFTASQRLNDLTGYSGIETLKKEIERQESQVQASRRAVKDTREAYAQAISTRSTTQREVNDLLHRKHAWSPTDLERFTSLYRSDHANEQAEIAAQKDVGDAEAKYEESSTRLARTILARYHEEQIWSDKIRQMSTWGTWGLMGLNVLLFVVFQILIEPWRRRRLVQGFEKKVELALQERDRDIFKVNTANMNLANPGVLPTTATSAGVESSTAEKKVDTIADTIAEQIVDAVTGSAPPSSETDTSESPQPTPDQAAIEAAAEQVTVSELNDEVAASSSSSSSSSPITSTSEPSTTPVPTEPTPLPQPTKFPLNGAGIFAEAAAGYAYYEEAFRELFNDRKTVVLTQRELTTVALEGASVGAAVVGVLVILFRGR